MAFKHSSSSFTDLVADARIEYVNSFLKEIDNIIDFNKLRPKHKVRAKVEHSFALIKTQMQQSKTRFIGLLRNNMNFTVTLKLFAHKRMRAQMVGNR